jgi:hypothetical protein
MCWPWIISKRLPQVFHEFWAKCFYHLLIYLIILQVVRRCPLPNLCMEFYIQVSFFFFTNKFFLDMDILTSCKWTFNSYMGYFDYYLDVHWKKLNSICSMIQSYKHLPKEIVLLGLYSISTFNGLLKVI